MQLERSLRQTTALTTVALIALFALAACKGAGEQADTTTAAASIDTAPAASAAPGGASLNDAQIAHIAVTANSIDSTLGELARTKGRNARVKSFAQTMVRDHGAVNKQAVALAQKLGVTPQDNETSQTYQRGAQTAFSELEGKSGADFDRAYAAREVAYHEAVIAALDQTLIPNAQNAELKALLTQVRPNFEQHLALARQMQQAVGTTP